MVQTAHAPSPLLEALPQGILLLDGAGQVVQANAAARAMLDLAWIRPGATLQDAPWNLFSQEGAVLPLAETPFLASCSAEVSVAPRVLGWVPPDGNVRWLRVGREPAPVAGALVVMEEVTESHLAEAIFRARSRLAEVAHRGDLEALLRATLDEAELLTGSRIGFYHFLEDDQETLTLQAWSTQTLARFCKAEGKGMHYPVSKAGVWVDAIHAGRPVIHNDYTSLPHKKGLPEGHAEVLRELVVPVVRGGRIMGILGVGNRPFPYGERDVQIVQRLADVAWDLVQRVRAETALRQREADYRTLFQGMSQGAFRQEADGRLVDVNEAALQLLGLERETFLSRTSESPGWDVQDEAGEPLPPDRHPSMLALRTGAPVTGQVIGVLNPVKGDRIWVEVNAIPEFRTGENRPYRVMVTLHDLTERLTLETSLRESEARWQTVVEQAGDGFELLDEDGRFLQVNQATCHSLGYTREELLGMTLFQVDPLASAEGFREDFHARGGRPAWSFESIHVRKDGTSFPVEVTATVAWIGDTLRALALVRDISERRQAQAQLATSEARAKAMLQTAMDGVWLIDAGGLFVEANEAACRMVGYSRGELLGLTVKDVEAVESEAEIRAHLEQIARRGWDQFESRFRRKDGTEFPVEISVTHLADHQQMVAFFRDISGRKAGELALRESEAQYRAMFEASPVGIWEEDFSEVKEHLDALRASGVNDLRSHFVEHPEAVGQLAAKVRVLRTNRASVQALKAQSPETLVRDLPSYFTPASLDLFRNELCALAEGRTAFRAEGGFLDAMGNPLALDVSLVVQPGHESTWARVLFSFVDITERKAIETALLESQRGMKEALQFNDQLLSDMPIGCIVFDGASGQCVLANEALAELLGGPLHEVLRHNFRSLAAWRQTGLLEAAEVVLESRTSRSLDIEITTSYGRHLWMRCDLSVFTSTGGLNLLVLCQDVTHRKEAEVALSQSERKFRSLFESMEEGFALHEIVTDEAGVPVDYRFLDVNPAFEAITGIPRNQWIGRRVLEVLPDTEPRWIEAYGKVALEGTPVTFEGDSQGLGRVYRVTAYRPAPRQFAVLATDISEQRRASEARRLLERQVAKSQRMESLGSLAGGVAHDMNNVLGAIMGLASIHRDAEPEGTSLWKNMNTILKACTRGRTMVKGLLGFARQGLETVHLIDLNEVVKEHLALLERTLPAEVRIVADLAGDLRPVLGDPSTLGHALMNLSVNAFDAMPEGGTLSIRTFNQGEDQVSLEIRDTGTGMPPEVMEKAMDPFFTTKPEGKGTGLGLAIVYGTVKAHHGKLELTSAVGEGTRILLQFPGTQPQEIPPSALKPAPAMRPLVLLLVDDDDLVQESSFQLLRSMGHSPILASSGEEALERLGQGFKVDAVLLDFNMPGLGGAGTLPILRRDYPGLPVLLVTGRADQRAMDLIHRFPGTRLLAKPYAPEEVARELAELDQP